MTEKEQEIQVSLYADKMLRQALDTKDNNKLIKQLTTTKTMTTENDIKKGLIYEIELNNGTIIKGKIENLNPLKVRTSPDSNWVIPYSRIKNIKTTNNN